MAVLLTISELINGGAIADALAGGGNGVDFGSVVSGQFAPAVDVPTNDGSQILYIRHDAVTDPITDLKSFIQQFGLGTSFTYGGADSAANDITTVLDQGDADNMGAGIGNNSDGLGNGLAIDMDFDVSTVDQFKGSRVGTEKEIYGDDGGAAAGNGRNLATAFPMVTQAMVKESGGSDTAPSTPVQGSVGKAGDAVLGDRAKPRFRYFLATSETSGV